MVVLSTLLQSFLPSDHDSPCFHCWSLNKTHTHTHTQPTPWSCLPRMCLVILGVFFVCLLVVCFKSLLNLRRKVYPDRSLPDQPLLSTVHVAHPTQCILPVSLFTPHFQFLYSYFLFLYLLLTSLSFSFCRWKSWASQRQSSLPKVMVLGTMALGIQLWSVWCPKAKFSWLCNQNKRLAKFSQVSLIK